MKRIIPFPFPLNIGTDICQISRIYSILNSPKAGRFINRVFSPEEPSRYDPRLKRFRDDNAQKLTPGNEETKEVAENGEKRPLHEELALKSPEVWQAASFLAGRFAAKEAAMKAHTHRRLNFHDIIIERRPSEIQRKRLGSGPPVARIKARDETDEDVSAMVSISHDGDYATAVCLAADPHVMDHWDGSEPM